MAKKAADLLKKDGYMERADLCAAIQVVVKNRTNRRTIATRISSALSQWRLVMIDHDLVVCPEERQRNGLYDPKLVNFFAAFLGWRESEGRPSAFAQIEFRDSYFSGEKKELSFVPQKGRELYPVPSRRKPILRALPSTRTA